jgi:hypothetical protein
MSVGNSLHIDLHAAVCTNQKVAELHKRVFIFTRFQEPEGTGRHDDPSGAKKGHAYAHISLDTLHLCFNHIIENINEGASGSGRGHLDPRNRRN